jgi:gluconate 2-dehydrogenase subunit 3-like protein
MKLVEAFAETIIPSGDDKEAEPGANEIGVKNFFDSILATYPKDARQEILQLLDWLQEESGKLYEGRRFESLDQNEKGWLIRSLMKEPRTKFSLLKIRDLCIMGFYSDYHDPEYAGKTAWEWIGFRGKGLTDLNKDWSFLEVYKSRSKKSS